MNLVGGCILIFLIGMVLAAPRKWAFMGMMAGVLYLTEQQQINLGGFNLFAYRFLELAGFFRVIGRREFSFGQLNKIDHALLWLYAYTTVVYLLRSTEGQAYEIGTALDAFLCYFSFRGLLTDMDDFRWFLRTFLFLIAPYALLVLSESITAHNPFTVLGAPEAGAWMRNGRPRCLGSFRQPDTLGMFAASFIPLYIGMACVRKERVRAILSIGFCIVIAWAANSGGAASAAAMGFFGWSFWVLRMHMRRVRWSIVGILVATGLLMKAPIWYIFQHISSVTGGDGWHRSYLMDVSYRHLSEWWFIGMPFMNTKDWFPYDLVTTGVADITNQFIAFGLQAGMGALILFIFLLSRAFSNLGKALAMVRSNTQQIDGNEFLLWGLGVVLLIHIVDWFGITYFDQMYVVWFMQLAAISAFSEHFQKINDPISEHAINDEVGLETRRESCCHSL